MSADGLKWYRTTSIAAMPRRPVSDLMSFGVIVDHCARQGEIAGSRQQQLCSSTNRHANLPACIYSRIVRCVRAMEGFVGPVGCVIYDSRSSYGRTRIWG